MFPTSISQPCLYFSEAVVLFGTNGLLQSTVLIAVGLVIGREEANAAPEESSPKSEGVSSTTTQEAKQITVHHNVLSPDGQPVAGAIVHAGVGLWANLKWLAGPDAKPPVSEAKTGPSGEFTVSFSTQPFGDLSSLDRGWQDMWRQTDIVASAPGYGAAWVEYEEIQPGKPTTLRLVPDVPIEGRVVGPRASPSPA